jgi:hypothetical protein
MPPEVTGRKQGRFAKGTSGNPAGRPRGSLNKVTQCCLDLLGEDAEAVMAKLIRLAKAGKPYALRLAVERLVPVRASRDRAVTLDLPSVEVAADLAGAAASVIAHAAAGEITLSEAREFLALLEAQRKVIETTDLLVRLEALQASSGLVPVAREEIDDPSVSARVRRLLSSETESALRRVPPI